MWEICLYGSTRTEKCHPIRVTLSVTLPPLRSLAEGYLFANIRSTLAARHRGAEE